ncbi:hypothetical protein LP419_16655 [Massilia sp. H-1]|nr:hypothetical protein LP419_16655 [Massilia sp. H-1]
MSSSLLPSSRMAARFQYTTEGQRAFLAFAQDGMTMIPATARNLNAFQRVDLPFDSWAVLDYGGIVLQPGGVLDQHWLDHMRAAMQAALPGLRELAALIDAWAERTGFAMRAPDRRLRHAVLPGRQGRRQDRRAPRTDRARGGGAVDRRRRARLLHSPQRQQPGDPAECPEQVARGGLCHAAAARAARRHSHLRHRRQPLGRAFMAACDYAIVPRGTQLA